MYESSLQEYAREAAIQPPAYTFIKEGPSNAPCFKATVIIDNVTYESPPGFPSLESAQRAAAKVALDGLSQSSYEKKALASSVYESRLCKNLLQEYAQKERLPLPVYQSRRSGGPDHFPTFTSVVELAGVKYSGGFAPTKKGAEMKAARTALLAIQVSREKSGLQLKAPRTALLAIQASESGDVSVTIIPAPDVATAPGAALISTHPKSTPGKKREHNAANAPLEEPGAERLKTVPHNALGYVEDSVKRILQTNSLELIEDIGNLVSKTVPEVQDSSVVVSAAAPSPTVCIRT